MDNDNFTTTGITGLAMIVGQLRAELDRLRDDTTRDNATLRTAFSEFQSEQESRATETLNTVKEIVAVVKDFAATTTKSTGHAGRKPTVTDEEESTPFPTLNTGERPNDYHKRVATWAKGNGEDEPPKPPTGPVANSRAYAAKVAGFYAVD
jgi:hypothetical protein